jgi:cytochrome P450
LGIDMTGESAAPPPPQVVPPERPLKGFRAVAALKNSPIEAMPRGVFEGPVVDQRLLGRQLLWVADPEGVKTVLLDEVENFPKGFVQRRVLRPITGDGLLTSEGAHWRFQRRAAAPEFTPPKALAFTPVFVAASRAAAETFRAGIAGAANGASGPRRARIDVAEVMTATTFKVIGDALLSGEGGIDVGAFSRALAAYKATIGRATWFDVLGLPAWTPRPAYWKGGASLKRIRSMALRLVKSRARRRRKSGPPQSPDLLDLLMGAKDPETARGLARAELVDNVVTLATAGHETTALALTWALYLLALHPEIQERAADEARSVLGGRDAAPDDIGKLILARTIIEESLRLYTPTPIMTRTARKATTVCGVPVRKGGNVALALYALHRRADLWENADAFDPDRFSPLRSKDRPRFQFAPFGGGPRVCIGASFAMAEATVILATVLRDFRFAPDPREVVRLKHVITLRPENGMPLWVGVRG